MGYLNPEESRKSTRRKSNGQQHVHPVTPATLPAWRWENEPVCLPIACRLRKFPQKGCVRATLQTRRKKFVAPGRIGPFFHFLPFEAQVPVGFVSDECDGHAIPDGTAYHFRRTTGNTGRLPQAELSPLLTFIIHDFEVQRHASPFGNPRRARCVSSWRAAGSRYRWKRLFAVLF